MREATTEKEREAVGLKRREELIKEVSEDKFKV